MTRLAGYQPQYFPRLHYFARILNADVFTISDYLQYVRKHAYAHKDGTTSRGVSYQAHTPIKTSQGPLLLDIPVKRGGENGRQMIHEAPIDYATTWQQKNLNSIYFHYHKAPQFSAIFPDLSVVMMQKYETLAGCTVASILWSLSVLLEICTHRPKGPTVPQLNNMLPHADFRLKKVARLSDSDIAPPNKEIGRDANEWIIDTCKKMGAEEYYYGGTSAAAYMDFDRLKNAGITLVEQDWQGREYSQLHGAFIPNLSILDLLMNVTPAEARSILSTANQ
ncbi:MAG TPA: WbqC family protein [Candidatus Paceibacterota bacterium]|nr:WbqC family protein [Candidatus Paceibacterota bacterium]